MNTHTETLIAYEKYQQLDTQDAHLFRLLGLLIEAEFGTEVVAIMLDTSLRSARLAIERLVEQGLVSKAPNNRYTISSRMRRLAQRGLEGESTEVQTATRLQAIQWYSHLLKKPNGAVDPLMDILAALPAPKKTD